MSIFPPVEEADRQSGLLAFGGDLDVETLLEAYSLGIFPWPLDERYLTWFAPPRRAVLFLDDYHVSASLLKVLKRKKYEINFDTAFEEVIKGCAFNQNRRNQSGTWITKGMIGAYTELHRRGYAHSVECFKDGVLAGGLYGVSIGSMFAGESMFYDQPDCSKLSLHYLVGVLKAQNVKWIDCQVMTPHLKRFGAVEIPRAEFTSLLNQALAGKKPHFSLDKLPDGF